MHGDATNIVTSDLDLSTMKTRSNRQADIFGFLAECQSAPHGSTRTVKSCKNAVARALHQISAVLANKPARNVVMAV